MLLEGSCHCGAVRFTVHSKHPVPYQRCYCSICRKTAGAVDTALPEPPEYVHMMVGSKAPWVAIEGRPGDARFYEYPEESLADWHRKRGLEVE